MFRLLVIFTVLGALLAEEPPVRFRYDGYKIYQVNATESQGELLIKLEHKKGYDFFTRRRKGPNDIMVAPAQQAEFVTFLRTNGIKYKVINENVQVGVDKERESQLAAKAERTAGKISFKCYSNNEEIDGYLDNMAATYPKVASVHHLGNTSEGRVMKLLKISSGGSDKPVVWIDAGVHAREWIAHATALYVIHQLLEVQGNAGLYAERDWWILPVANPDGYVFSHTQERMWRKNRGHSGSNTCIGVDLNRNFDFHWNDVGASADPCNGTYSGPKFFSEPESRHMRDVIQTNRHRIKVYLTLHSYGNYFLYPWAWTTDFPSDWKILQALATKADAAQQAAGGSPYEIGAVATTLYAAAGSSMDWTKGVANISLSFAVELPPGGDNGFDPPPSDIHDIVKTFFPAVKVLAQAVV